VVTFFGQLKTKSPQENKPVSFIECTRIEGFEITFCHFTAFHEFQQMLITKGLSGIFSL